LGKMRFIKKLFAIHLAFFPPPTVKKRIFKTMVPAPFHPDPPKEKTAVILGFARQGQALARWLPTVGAKVIVSDTRNLGDLADAILAFLGEPISFALGGHPLELLDDADVIFLSGGVSPTLPICEETGKRGIPL